MPIISADKAKSEYDVVIVGSGAGGGQTAYALTLAGLKCVMLEAGRNYNPLTETAMFNTPAPAPSPAPKCLTREAAPNSTPPTEPPMFNTPAQAPLMGEATPDKPFGFH